jgi:allantoicase
MQEQASFGDSIDLASADIGGEALLSSDDFFAGMANLLKRGRSEWIPHKYTERGKWMDGWESRRKRVPGHDWCIIHLGVAGRIRGVDIDTNHFLGNHPPFASLDACNAPTNTSPGELRDAVEWTTVLPQIPLQRGSQNLASVASQEVWTHVRLNIYPAGGVARLRVYGQACPEPCVGLIDLVGLRNGGRALACSDMFFSPMNNLLLPNRATDMGQGWETRRSRPPGDDWVILAMGRPGLIEQLTVDTKHFKGNYPDRCAVDALYWPDAPASALVQSDAWTQILPSSKLRAHEEREFQVSEAGPWTHVRLRIFPDGGISRLRVWGRECAESPTDALTQAINGADEARLRASLSRCCGARRWVQAMIDARPFHSRTHLFGLADWLWWHLGDGDWLEAFSHHPEIGADVEKLREKFARTASLSAAEQAGVSMASEEVLQRLAEANKQYKNTYGYLFIVCASGKSAAQMLAILEERLDNEPAAELRIAAGEQRKITQLRLQQLEIS